MAGSEDSVTAPPDTAGRSGSLLRRASRLTLDNQHTGGVNHHSLRRNSLDLLDRNHRASVLPKYIPHINSMVYK